MGNIALPEGERMFVLAAELITYFQNQQIINYLW